MKTFAFRRAFPLTWYGCVFLSVLLAGPVAGQAPQFSERGASLLEESLTTCDPALVTVRAEAARRLFAEAGDMRGEGISLLMTGVVEICLGDHGKAQSTLERASKMVRKSGDNFSLWMLYFVEAWAWRSMNKLELSVVTYESALNALKDLEVDDAPLSLEFFRYIEPQKYPQRVAMLNGTSLVEMKAWVLRLARVGTLVEMAVAQRELARYAQALATLREARALEPPFAQMAAQVLLGEGEVELQLDHTPKAQALLEAALPPAREAVDLALQARILRSLAEVHRRRGEPAKVTELLGQADALAPVPAETKGCGVPGAVLGLLPDR